MCWRQFKEWRLPRTSVLMNWTFRHQISVFDWDKGPLKHHGPPGHTQTYWTHSESSVLLLAQAFVSWVNCDWCETTYECWRQTRLRNIKWEDFLSGSNRWNLEKKTIYEKDIFSTFMWNAKKKKKKRKNTPGLDDDSGVCSSDVCAVLRFARYDHKHKPLFLNLSTGN